MILAIIIIVLVIIITVVVIILTSQSGGIRIIKNISDPEGIKNGKYKQISNNDFFGSNTNSWYISINFNLDKFNNTTQSILGNLDSNGWGLWITPLRKLQWRVGRNTTDLNNLGELKDNTLYQIDIKYSNGNYTFKLKPLESNKSDENFQVIEPPPLVVSGAPIITNSGFITVGGATNNKFLGSINEVKTIELESIQTTTMSPIIQRTGQTTGQAQTTTMSPISRTGQTTGQTTTMSPIIQRTGQAQTTNLVQITTSAPTTTSIPTIVPPPYVIEDPEGIKNGKYSEISLKTFGFVNNIKSWTLTILFTPITANKYQGIIGNIYNVYLPTYLDGWGFWISPEQLIHFRIQSWYSDLPILDKLKNNTQYKLIINYTGNPSNNNIGTYNISLTNLSDNTVKSTKIEDKAKLIYDKGRICVGGNWSENPNAEKFDGVISYVNFSRVLNVITNKVSITKAPFTITNTGPQIDNKTWIINCNENTGSIDFVFGNKKALNLKFKNTSASMNSWDGENWNSDVIINNFPPNIRPFSFIVIFDTKKGFTISYKDKNIANYPNIFYIENAKNVIFDVDADSDIILENNKVKIFTECNFEGNALEVKPGSYGDAWLADRGFNDNVKSIIIPEGMRVKAYSDAMWGGFQSEFGTYISNVLCGLHSISGIIVSRI